MTVYVCPERDIECGMRPANWCKTCPKREDGMVPVPITLQDGTIKQSTLRIAGKPFRCHCGCNVFHQPNMNKPEIYRCNACTVDYESA